MKIKLLILGLGLGASILAGCNDDVSSIGTSIQPGDDTIAVYTDTFRIQATTVQLDSIYARSTSAQLGELYDPLYGNLVSDYMCQFYCPNDFQFAHTPYEGKIDSVDFCIYYNGTNKNGVWVGDSLAPMRAEIFEITSPLQKNFYTNIDPAKYCNMQKSMGAQAYTAYNASISDSLRDDDYSPHIRIKMPTEFGQKLYDETIKNPGAFKNQETFNEFFPGLYVTNTFGSGNILSVASSVLRIYYNHAVKSTAGKDSLIKTWEAFSVTKEVIQLSRFKNTDMSQLLQPNEDYAFFKTPAGVCTRIVLPTKEITPIMKERIVNNLPLELKAMPQENWQYALNPPSYLLILPEDSIKSFFEGNQVNNNVTYFLSDAYNETTRTYTFPNLANLLKYQIEKDPDNDLALLVIPVDWTYTTNNSYYGSGEKITTAITNYLAPSGVKIRKDEEVMKIGITSCKYAR
ncbi:DUF4270 domain-containing protein [uncultured Parabacteroides sp.]|uniref:DUF4270 domain-containing protein n=1 Tax=uncultured Parabacteroides sp. TaxID=512312 RepID=UPI00261CF6C0|nr:DUF4270 domain-containing protein [uncultured Parabacteroides sp.]